MGFDLKSARHWAQAIHREAILPGAVVIDATMGNGGDTLSLCQLVGDTGKVYAFDISSHAMAATQQRLCAAGCLERAQLFCVGHEQINLYVHEPIDAAVFNLGWLPGSDKSVRTRAQSTLAALDQCLILLKKRGIITVCAYPGHDEGMEELSAAIDWAQNLPGNIYQAMIQRYLNQPNDPPVLIAVQKC